MSETDHPASEISYEDSLPLRWHAGAPLPGSGEWARLAQEAEETLRALLFLDSVAPEGTDDEAGGPEIQRLELKLNLVLDLVAQLIHLQSPMPPARTVCISAQTLIWTTDEAAPQGEGVVEIYLAPRHPRSLKLPARIREVSGPANNLRVIADWVGLAQAVVQSLEKIIFRQHRRAIALRRRAAAASADAPAG